MSLSANRQAFREQWRQAGLDDFLLRGGELVLNPPLLDDVVLHVVNAVSGAPIGVARLANAPDVNEILFARLDAEQFGADASDALVADKGHGHVSVTEEANGRVLIGETRGRVEVIEDVAPLARSIEGGVHDGKIAHLPLQAQVAQPYFVLRGEVIARPLDGALGQFIKVARGFDQRGLFVMIALDDGAVHVADAFDALVRVGVVTDDVAQANKVRAVVLVRVIQHGIKRLKVGMNITADRETHLL